MEKYIVVAASEGGVTMRPVGNGSLPVVTIQKIGIKKELSEMLQKELFEGDQINLSLEFALPKETKMSAPKPAKKKKK